MFKTNYNSLWGMPLVCHLRSFLQDVDMVLYVKEISGNCE